jgi:hypothetical protein
MTRGVQAISQQATAYRATCSSSFATTALSARHVDYTSLTLIIISSICPLQAPLRHDNGSLWRGSSWDSHCRSFAALSLRAYVSTARTGLPHDQGCLQCRREKITCSPVADRSTCMSRTPQARPSTAKTATRTIGDAKYADSLIIVAYSVFSLTH